MRRLLFLMFCFGIFSCAPVLASAATTFEVSGWLPYWREASSTNDVIPHISELTEVDPFVYSLASNGTLVDNAPMTDAAWQTLVADAKAQHVRVIPTIMTSDGAMLHALLSNTTKRVALETYIANFVQANGYDGIEIDFEGKEAQDKDYFSTFLKGLYERMGNKFVDCDIEARTPISSEYYGTTVPADAGDYANDYTQINKYCDRVKLMTYDQQTADQLLAATAASSSELYAPVSDPAWIEKVVALAEQSIDKNKILIGIPTYGYEYDVTAYAANQFDYSILWTFNPGYATQIEQQFGVSPSRAPWGEEELTYLNASAPTSPPASVSSFSGLAAAAAAATYATSNNSHADFRLLVWPDAQSIAGKIALAKALGVRGVAIFKLDGGEDPGIWNALSGVAQSATVAPAVSGSSISSAPSISGSITSGLDLGITSSQVLTLQQILNTSADTQVASSGVGSPGHETDYFGPATQAAVEKFQVKYGIASSGDPGYGYVGPATRAKLNSLRSG